MPSPQISNPAGAFGETALSTYTGDDLGALYVTMRAAVTTIVRGDLVALSTSSGYCIRALTNTGAQLLIGVAQESQDTTGDPIQVCIYGPFKGANKDNTVAVTAAYLVTRSAAVTATVLSLSQATAVTTLAALGTTIGIVMADASAAATTCDIFVCKV